MLTDVPEICPACATGKRNSKHNWDRKTCRFGRLEAISFLEHDEQIEALRVEERLPVEVATMVVALAKERNKNVLEILQEEKMLSA
jgi:hypothetical protein